MSAVALSGGFADPPQQSARAFRSLLAAMARPGKIEEIAGITPPAPLSPAAGAVLLVLCDPDTPLHLAGAADCAQVRDWVGFHTGAPLVAAPHAAFAVGRWPALQPLSAYPAGTSAYPDRSATLIVEMDQLASDGAVLRGPGIAEQARLSLPETEALAANAARFPLGLDFFLTCGTRLAALPRSTRVEPAAPA